jgi:CRP/FNR family transcriptional regulator, cyclic AMP receptor protein
MFTFSRHAECSELSGMFRGSLCEQFTGREGRAVAADERIYDLGEAARSIFFLRQGLVKITALSKEGKEIILNVHKPGEIFGEFCLCGGARNEAAVAMDNGEVVEITLEDLTRHLQQNHAAMYNFLVTVCERLSRAYDTIQELSFDRLGDRLAKVLLRLADEFGQQAEGGTELQHYISQEELAQMLSARREAVSTALNRLRDKGLIGYSRRGKLTIDRVGLAAFVETGLAVTAASQRSPN